MSPCGPDCRRRGVAGKLLDVFERFAEGNHLAFLSLEVRASNYAAIALYGSTATAAWDAAGITMSIPRRMPSS